MAMCCLAYDAGSSARDSPKDVHMAVLNISRSLPLSRARRLNTLDSRWRFDIPVSQAVFVLGVVNDGLYRCPAVELWYWRSDCTPDVTM